MKPRTPHSPPLMPVITLSLNTCGALVLTAPSFGSPFFTLHTTLPVLASSATSMLSACCRKILPSAYARPRFTVSQHICATTALSCFGSYFHFIFCVSRSSPKTLLGNGECRYMVPSTTSGEPSWPRSTPVEKVHATCILQTLPVLICLSWL